MRRPRAAVLLLLAPFCVAAAQPAPAPSEQVGTTLDSGDRMRVPVMIGGAGPYRFVVDTGAERTVVASEVAQALRLPGSNDVSLTSLAHTGQVSTVRVAEIQVGRRRFLDLEAPVLPQGVLGAHGLLGIDALRNQNVEFDFRNGVITVSDAVGRRRSRDPDGTIVVEARPRHGRLIVSDATLNGQRVTVIVDTGSQITLGNAALRRALQRSNRLPDLVPVTVWGVTGQPFTAEIMRARRLRLGGVEVLDMPIGFGSSHLFERLDLNSRPALLLGIDALRAFERVSVDFAARRLRLLPVSSSLYPGTQLASVSPRR